VRDMPQFMRCRFIDQPTLFSGSWSSALRVLLAQPAPARRLATNGVEVAVSELLSVLDASR